jgi:hypothetical protein
MIVLRFSVEGEDNFERTNGNCHVVYILVCKRKTFLEHTNGKCHLCTLNQLVDHCVTRACNLITFLNILMPRY